MKAIKDLNHKRICDLSDDEKTVIIRKGNCETTVTAEENGTLSIKSRFVPPAP